MEQIEEEMKAVFGDLWTEFKGQSGGRFAFHTVMVLWKILSNNEFQQLDWDKQNVLKWAAICHSIKKLGQPVIFGRDHVHPFKSAVAIVDVMRERGVIEKDNKNWDQVK